MAEKKNTEQEVKKDAKGRKLVRIQLFKDNKHYKEPLFVGVNGETFLVQRGVPVDVPDYVAEVIRNSEAQDHEAFMAMEELARDGEWDQ